MDPQQRMRLWRLKGMEALEAPEQSFLLHNMTDEIRPRVAAVTWSKQGHPTFLLPKADGYDVMQILFDKSGKFSGCRASPNASEMTVWAVMSSFLRAGHSIDPAHVKFGESEGFKDRMVPIWTQAFERYTDTQSLMLRNPLYDNLRPNNLAYRGLQA